MGSSDIYVALLGNDYGREDKDGLSPNHREFCEATRLGKHRLVFVKGATDSDKHPKMQALITEAGAQLIRRRFLSSGELLPSIYASLVDFIAAKELLRFGPFDATPCPDANMEDLSSKKIRLFLGIARRARGFPLSDDTLPVHLDYPKSQPELLRLLQNMSLATDEGMLNLAGVLLFAERPEWIKPLFIVKAIRYPGNAIQSYAETY